MKLTTVVNFINILGTHFLYKILAPKNYKAEMKLQSQTLQLCNFWRQNIGEKSVRKMLMKLTPVVDFTRILQAISLCQKISNTNYNYRKAANKNFIWKSCSLSVGEIDTWS